MLKQKAKILVASALKKAVPYYGYADAIMTGTLMAKCVIDCQGKK